MQVNNFYVYEHIRPDANRVFYVGKGSGYRAGITQHRNQYWKNIVAKAGGFKVRKIVENVDEELAFLAEEERIDQLKRLGYKLANLTSGGEGVANPSEETRKKLSFSRIGEKNPRFNVNSIRQKRLRGELNVPKEIMSANMKANHWSKTGVYKPLKGLKKSEQTKQNMKEAHKLRALKECSHCGYIGKPVTIHRWHLDKCKKANKMEKNEKTPIVVDEVTYYFEDMTQEQQNLVNHIEDLARKINSSQFNLDQLRIGQQAFVNLLKEALTKPTETVQ